MKRAAIGTIAAISAVGAGLSLLSSTGRAALPSLKPAAKTAGAPTFNKEIAPIVFKNCSSCHRPGEVAPFSLLTYADVKKRAAQIALVTQSHTMPPWKADSHGEFVNERRLTADQISALKQWADAGAPQGTGAAPAAPAADEGEMGKPDAYFQPSKAYTLGAEGRDVYRCFVIPTNYTEDRYISALEVKPGNRNIVHHVLVFLDTSGAARRLDGKDSQPGYSTFGGVGFIPAGGLGGWAPGNMPHPLPAGVGNLLPKGSDIVLQVHYHKSGKEETDLTRIGLYFCKGPVDKRVRTSMVINPFLRIPAGDANYTINASLPVPADCTLLEVTPHMHLLGKSMKVTASLPDGSTKQVVNVPDWDFNWQTTYTFKEPMKLPAKSSLSLVAKYDNSTGNPRNPSSPPKLTGWGEQTTDEMCIAFVGYTVDSEHLTKGVSSDGMREFGQRRGAGGLLRQFLNRNGGGQ